VNDYSKLVSSLYINKAGTEIGEIKSQKLIPSHEFALSFLLKSDTSFFQADKNSALNYLRKNNMAVDMDATGWQLVKYSGLNLGWIKVLEQRINNYYPSEWRIKM
jgi:NOL1/NOP2/fmu family ribosome biogenesis protein